RVYRSLTNPEGVQVVNFSPDGSTLACGDTDAGLSFWKYRAGKRLRSIRTHLDEVRLLAFSPDGSILASGNGDSGRKAQVVELWSMEDGQLLRALKADGNVSSVAFGPDGKKLALGSNDFAQGGPRVELWDLRNGTRQKQLWGHH